MQVAGARWAGVKTRIVDSDDDGDSEAEPNMELEIDHQEEDQEMVVVMAPQAAKRGRDVVPSGRLAPGDEERSCKKNKAGQKNKKEEASERKKVKWNKLAAGVLKEAPKQRLKHSKLQKQLMELAGLPAIDWAGDVLQKLRKSARFVVSEKYVAFVTAA